MLGIRKTGAGSKEDLTRLFSFLVEQDIQVAEPALDVINKAIVLLETFPFTCRKSQAYSRFLREMVISVGASGYVALFEIEENNIATILAI
jgi:hypothetical protein